jgi:hypothetical protein
MKRNAHCVEEIWPPPATNGYNMRSVGICKM